MLATYQTVGAPRTTAYIRFYAGCMVMHIATLTIGITASVTPGFAGTANFAGGIIRAGIPHGTTVTADIFSEWAACAIIALEKWGIIRSACGGFTPVVRVGLSCDNTGNALTCGNDAGIPVVVEYQRIV